MGAEGREHPAKLPENPSISGAGDANSDATVAAMLIPAISLHPDLAELAKSWETLAPAIRAGILAMIRAAKQGG